MNARSCRRATQLIAVSVAALTFGMNGAWALSADSYEGGSSNKDKSDELADIIVTAQKRNERLQDVPIAITVITGEELVRNSQVLLQDYFATVPGLTIDDLGTGRVSITMRGISTGDGNNPTVGVTLDEVPLGATNTAAINGSQFVPQIDPADLDHIEFLKGPQGTLYGATTLGGEMKYVTAVPNLQSLTDSVAVSGQAVDGGGAGYSIRDSLNVPLIDNALGLRISAFDRHDPGFVSDPKHGLSDVNDRKVYGGLLSLLYDPSNTLSFRLTSLYQKDEIGGDGSLDTVTPGYTPIFGNLNNWRLPNSNIASYENQVYIGTLKISLDPFDITSITGYSRANYNEIFDVSPFYSAFVSPPGTVAGSNLVNFWDSSKFTEEFRLSSYGRSRLDWQAGVFYDFDNNYNNSQTVTVNDLNTGIPINANFVNVLFPTKYDEISIFGNITYHFTDRFNLQLGAREAHNGQDFYSSQTGAFGTLPPSRFGSHESPFTYLVTPEFHISKDILVYGRWSTGYQAGGGNAPQPIIIPLQYKSSRTENFEFGIKSTFLDDRLSLDTDAFYIKWTNIEIQGGTIDGSYIYNGGTARSEGIESAISAKPLHGLTISNTLAFTNAEFTNTNTSINGFATIDGNPLPYAMRWNGSLSAEQRFQLTDSVGSFIGATWAYIGQRWNPPACGTCLEFAVPAYRTVNARAGLEWNGYTLTAFARNITNERGIVGAIPQSQIPPYNLWGNYHTAIITPRTVGITLMKSF